MKWSFFSLYLVSPWSHGTNYVPENKQVYIIFYQWWSEDLVNLCRYSQILIFLIDISDISQREIGAGNKWERNIFPPLVHSLNVHNSQGWVWLKPGAVNSIWDFLMVAGLKFFNCHPWTPRGHISKKLGLETESRCKGRHSSTGWIHPKLCLHHNQMPITRYTFLMSTYIRWALFMWV